MKTHRHLDFDGTTLYLWCCRGMEADYPTNSGLRVWMREDIEKSELSCSVCGAVYLTLGEVVELSLMPEREDAYQRRDDLWARVLRCLDLVRTRTPRQIKFRATKRKVTTHFNLQTCKNEKWVWKSCPVREHYLHPKKGVGYFKPITGHSLSWDMDYWCSSPPRIVGSCAHCKRSISPSKNAPFVGWSMAPLRDLFVALAGEECDR